MLRTSTEKTEWDRCYNSKELYLISFIQSYSGTPKFSVVAQEKDELYFLYLLAW